VLQLRLIYNWKEIAAGARMKLAVQICLCCFALLLGSGCATSALWSDTDLHRFAPAKPANLALLQRKDGRKILVTYDESLDEGAAKTRRAYWIEPAAEPSTAADKRPVFVSLRNENQLKPVPVGEAPQPNGYSAVVGTNAVAFTLFADGQKLWRYELPVYERTKITGKQVALTPLAVAADLTIVGGVAAVNAAAWYAGADGVWIPKSSETK
jgi:hypothetical protein